MTATTQDFTTYAGDAVSPVFTVTDGTTAIDLSGVQEITWNARRTPGGTAVLSKTKTGAGIAFVNTGTDGKFKVILTAANTTGLTGFYVHDAEIKDESGNVSTVALGRMQIGPLPAWSYSGDPSLSDKDAVRFWLQDTDETDQKIMDGEIAFVLTSFPNPLRAAAQCARTLAAKYAKKVNRRIGDLSISYSDLQKSYLELADRLEMQASMDVTPYAGGISEADKDVVEDNTDRVEPSFRLKQFDDKSASGFASTDWDTDVP